MKKNLFIYKLYISLTISINKKTEIMTTEQIKSVIKNLESLKEIKQNIKFSLSGVDRQVLVDELSEINKNIAILKNIIIK